MSIEEFASKFIKAEDEAWQKGSFEALEKLEDPNVVYHIPPFQDTVGWESHKQYIISRSQAMSDLSQEWEYLTGDSDVFALSYKSCGKFTGEIPGMPPPTGKEITMDHIFVCHLKDGRIDEVWAKGTVTGIG